MAGLGGADSDTLVRGGRAASLKMYCKKNNRYINTFWMPY